MGEDKKRSSRISEKAGIYESDGKDRSDEGPDWIIGAIDTLASEYHWSKKDILEGVYFDELFDYIEAIRKRVSSERLIQLAIVSNPHIEDSDGRERLYKTFLDEIDSFKEEEGRKDDFDPSEIDRLKIAMADNPRIIIK